MGSTRFYPYLLDDVSLACTRHRPVPDARTSQLLKRVAERDPLSELGLDRTLPRLRNLLAVITWFARCPERLAAPLVDANDAGDRTEGRMGVLGSYRSSMHVIFETLQARDGFDRKEATILRTLFEKALTWCSDLLVYAPLLLGKEDRALTWREATQKEWPIRDAMVLVEQAIPVVRDEPLCAARCTGRCMICLLHRELLGFELGLGVPHEHKRVQFGGGMARGGIPVNQPAPPQLPMGRRREPDKFEEWDTRLSLGDQAQVLCDGFCHCKRRGEEGAFKDRRMRFAGSAGRTYMWGTGVVPATWLCGM